jgi:dTDP-D-glucose 4,6-dehydratase
MILATGNAGFIGSNFSSGITRSRALASTEIPAESFVTRGAAL